MATPIYKPLNGTQASINSALSKVPVLETDVSVLNGRANSTDSSVLEIKDKIGVTINHGTLDTSGYILTENDTHIWGSVPRLDISHLDSSIGNYLIIFSSPVDSSTSLTLPSNVVWNAEMITDINKTYYLGIIREHGFFTEFDNPATVTE